MREIQTREKDMFFRGGRGCVDPKRGIEITENLKNDIQIAMIRV